MTNDLDKLMENGSFLAQPAVCATAPNGGTRPLEHRRASLDVGQRPAGMKAPISSVADYSHVAEPELVECLYVGCCLLRERAR